MTEPETHDALSPDAEPAEPDAEALARAESDAAAEAAAVAPADPTAPLRAADAAVDRQALIDNDEPDDALTSNDYSVAFSPRQVAVGLAIVAGLIAVVAARRRGRKRSGGG